MDKSIRSKRDGYKLYDIANFPDKRILSFRDQNITVSASYLSLHSSIFYKMFYVDNNGNGTIQLDEDPKIFGDLLDFIYPSMKKTNCCVECSDSFLNRFKLGVKLRLRFAVRRLIEEANEKYLPEVLQILADQKFVLADIKKSIIDRFGSFDDIRKKFPKFTPSMITKTEEKDPIAMTKFPDNCLIKLKCYFYPVSASSLSLHSPKMRNLLFSKNGKINHFVEANVDPTSFQLFIDATKGIFPNEYSSSLLDILWKLEAIGIYEYYKEAMIRDISRWTGDPNRQPIICLLNHLHKCNLLNNNSFASITRNVSPSTTYLIIRNCPFTTQYFDELIKAEQRLIEEGLNREFHIFVKTLTGKTLKISTVCRDKVEDIKLKVQNVDGIPVDQQRLVYGGKQLEDERTMADYDITSLSTVHLFLNIRGC